MNSLDRLIDNLETVPTRERMFTPFRSPSQSTPLPARTEKWLTRQRLTNNIKGIFADAAPSKIGQAHDLATDNYDPTFQRLLRAITRARRGNR